MWRGTFASAKFGMWEAILVRFNMVKIPLPELCWFDLRDSKRNVKGIRSLSLGSCRLYWLIFAGPQRPRQDPPSLADRCWNTPSRREPKEVNLKSLIVQKMRLSMTATTTELKGVSTIISFSGPRSLKSPVGCLTAGSSRSRGRTLEAISYGAQKCYHMGCIPYRCQSMQGHLDASHMDSRLSRLSRKHPICW